jgi:cytosine/creatinine deaminase
MSADQHYMHLAFEQAQKSYDEGGLPIGAVMVRRDAVMVRRDAVDDAVDGTVDDAVDADVVDDGAVIATGYNRRVQDGDPTAHGEMSCLRNAGRRQRYDDVVMYTTLSPCLMCAGTIVQFGIPSVVIGEDRNFPGNIAFLREHGVDVRVLDDAACVALMARFISERPDLWDEDIAGRTDV